MPDEPRFLLGYGERLTERVPPPGGGGGSDLPYTYTEAVQRLSPRVSQGVTNLQDLPRSACPENEAVAVITLHPQSIAKSYYPQQLLDEFDLRQVGSRPVTVQPDKWTRSVPPEPTPTTDLYVAGKRDSFRQWAAALQATSPLVNEQIRRLEDFRAPTGGEKIRPAGPAQAAAPGTVLEVALHATNLPRDQYVIAAFEEYALSLDAEPDLDRRIYAGGLCFMPVEAPRQAIPELARFSFLRVVRPMPRLRHLVPVNRSIPAPGSPSSPLPDEDAVDDDLRIAIFDGGLEDDTPLKRWTESFDGGGVGDPPEDFLQHGHDVTSAALFGSIEPGRPAPRPFARVDHYGVLDAKVDSDPYELYDVLRRIENILKQKQYELFNLSLGPSLPVEDDEVHAWTAVLDDYLSDGRSLASIAVGNNGADDEDGLDPDACRIQVPSDAVNALAVGAADSRRGGWRRATYSAFGPGRTPGRVKPDLLHFGGEQREPFLVYEKDSVPTIAWTCGTSFAAPAALRLAAGVRAHFGTRLTPLALKALLVCGARDEGNPRAEVGWGRLSGDLGSLVTCPDNTVRVIYQGELNPAQYLRALIPLPDDSLPGNVHIRATFCYATPVDPQDPGSYTRSGLDVTFRPDARKFADVSSTEPAPSWFFRRSNYDSEGTLRRDAHKWDTVLNSARSMRGTSLYRPVFDLHYNARSGGGAARSAEPIRYALVVEVKNTRSDIYNAVLRAYSGRLEVLQPVVEIPVRT